MLLLTILGLLPFVFGGILNWSILTYTDTLPPLKLIGITVLILWGTIAFFVKPCIKSTWKTVICQNLVSFVILILLGVQELVFHAYWSNAIGIWTQLYYLPLLNIGYSLTMWFSTVFSACCAAFLLMVAATIIGCRLRK